MAVTGLVVGILGLVATVAGFTLAILQLRRTAAATEATTKAVTRTEKRMALNHLLVLLPQFRLLEADLDNAAEDNDRRLAIRALVAYSYIASEVAAMLRDQDGVDAALPDKLADTALTAAKAKAALVSDARALPKTATSLVRHEIAEVSTVLAGAVGTFRIEAGR